MIAKNNMNLKKPKIAFLRELMYDFLAFSYTARFFFELSYLADNS